MSLQEHLHAQKHPHPHSHHHPHNHPHPHPHSHLKTERVEWEEGSGYFAWVKKLTHLDERGLPSMVDVGEKAETERIAEAVGMLVTSAATLDVLEQGAAPKGDPLVVAQIAGIQAAKRTAELIPLCHQLPLTRVSVQLDIDRSLPGIRVRAEARVIARTGVEMEALTAATVALLTLYDMLKAIDRSMRIEGVRLTRKSGGRSGDYAAADHETSES